MSVLGKATPPFLKKYKESFMKVESYILGDWRFGSGNEKPLIDAVSGDEVGMSSTEGFDYGEILSLIHI